MPFHIELIAALAKMGVVIGLILTAVPMMVWLERKVLADFQARIGPSRVGPFGLLQSFADGIKLLAKEDILPANVDRLLYFVAPVVVMIPALAVAAVVPFGPDVTIGGHTHRLVIADLPVGVLFVLALTSLGVYGIVLCGWASNNKYSLLGGLRSAAQMVSYELPMGMSVVAALMIASASAPGGIFSMSLRDVVLAQSGGIWNWIAFNPRFAFLGLLAMLAFYICGLAETNRAPFDLPEAETELTGGFHTEYSSMKFAMFFLAEYAAMFNIAVITTTLFLGGWHAPWPWHPFPPGSILYALEGLVWVGIKVFAITILYMWIRATLPRLRYDRLMHFTWKALLPASLLNVLAIATILTVWFQQRAPAELLPPAPAAPQSPQVPPFTPPPGAPGTGAIPGLGNIPGGAPPGLSPGGAPPQPGAGPGGTAPSPGGAPGSPAPAPGGGPAVGTPAPGSGR